MKSGLRTFKILVDQDADQPAQVVKLKLSIKSYGLLIQGIKNALALSTPFRLKCVDRDQDNTFLTDIEALPISCDTLQVVPDHSSALPATIWNLSQMEPASKWEKIGLTTNSYLRLLIHENQRNLLSDSHPLVSSLNTMLTRFGTSLQGVKKAYALFNGFLFAGFEKRWKGDSVALANQYQQPPGKCAWKEMPDALQRYRFMDYFDHSARFYEWNQGSGVSFVCC